MMPAFDTVNERLRLLTDAQDEPSGCQVVFMPQAIGGAFYTIQIAYRGKAKRGLDVRQFLRSASKILREPDRCLLLRTYRIKIERDYETLDWISQGMMRLYAAEVGGLIRRAEKRVEPVGLMTLH